MSIPQLGAAVRGGVWVESTPEMFERLIWVVPLAVTVLGIWRPRAGLLVLAAALPLFGSSDGGPYLAALEVAALAAIVTAWRGGRPPESPLGPAVGAFLVVGLLSLLPLTYEPPSWRPSVILAVLRALPDAESWSAFFSWRAAADLIIGCALFQAVRRGFCRDSARPLALAVLAGLVASLLLGLAAHGGLLSLDAYRPAMPPGESIHVRLRSLFFASTRFAEYLAIATPFALSGLVAARPWARRLIVPLAGLSLVGLVLTLQRAAWGVLVAQLACLTVVALRRRKRQQGGLRRQALTAAATLVLGGSILLLSGVPLEPVRDRLATFRLGLGNRLPVWDAGLEMFRERPLLGHGLGSFAPTYDRLHAAGAVESVPFRASGHQLYLQLVAERGALGLLAFALLGAAAVLCLRQVRKGSEALALGLAVSLVGVCVYGLAQNLFQQRNVAWLLWIVLGCVALVSRRGQSVLIRRAAASLVVAALLVAPFRLASGAPDHAGTREIGFHELEPGGFQWTSGLALRRLRRDGDTLVLTLANGHPLGPRRPIQVAVDVDGRRLSELTVTGGWEEHRIDLRAVPPAEWVLLELSVEPTFRPFTDYQRYDEIAPSVDHRRLGVALRRPRWEP